MSEEKITSRRESRAPRREQRGERGIILAIVLVLIFALITAVYAFQRRAIIDATISRNRVDAAEADALAKGGIRVAEVLLMIVRAKQLGADAGGGIGPNTGDDPISRGSSSLGGGLPNTTDRLWQDIDSFPFPVGEDRMLKIEIEDEGAKLNLNALVPAAASTEGGDPLDPDRAPADPEEGTKASEEAIEFLEAALAYIIDGMAGNAEEKNYDAAKIAENLLDFIDGDQIAVNGRDENEYYRRLDPPYTAWNRPLASIDQVGLVEDIDPLLAREIAKYMTVHPIGDSAGINLNRAAPWVLKLIYSGNSGNRRLIDDRLATDLFKLREKGKLVCDDAGGDPRCISRSEVGNGELGNGGIYPEPVLPAKPTVFRVTTTAEVGDVTRRFEAILDTRPIPGPQVLSWRRLRGAE